MQTMPLRQFWGNLWAAILIHALAITAANENKRHLGTGGVKINLAFGFVVLARNMPKNLLFLRSNLLLPSILFI